MDPGSANNPYHGAYDCGRAVVGRVGQCTGICLYGQPWQSKGKPLLTGVDHSWKHTILAALHDTSSDEMAFYDTSFWVRKQFATFGERRQIWKCPKFECKGKIKEVCLHWFQSGYSQSEESHTSKVYVHVWASTRIGSQHQCLVFYWKAKSNQRHLLDRRAFMN